ncbi:MAG TPA: peroxiredoxin [Kofleriaceae bacterium]|nr:peroxiredoxin [Kofleriaceae bacterium]
MSLTVGQPAPSFTLPSSDGGTFALDDLHGTTVVIFFYPRDNTPGCTIEAQDFRDAVPALKKLGAIVVGVSKDSIASHCKFRDKFHLSFPLLSDPDGKVLEAYGAWGNKLMYGKPMVGIIRSTAIIGADGTVLRHWPKVSVKGHAADVVNAVAELTGQAAPKPAAPKLAAPKLAAPKLAAPKLAAKPAAPAKKAARPAKKPAKKKARG